MTNQHMNDKQHLNDKPNNHASTWMKLWLNKHMTVKLVHELHTRVTSTKCKSYKLTALNINTYILASDFVVGLFQT
jgi:hypothetical protein